MTAQMPLITDPLEAISRWLPREATQVSATAHTWRMLQARTGNSVITLAAHEPDTDTPVFGWVWDLTLRVDPSLPDHTFTYQKASQDGPETIGRVSHGGLTFHRDPAGEHYFEADDSTFNPTQRPQ